MSETTEVKDELLEVPIEDPSVTQAEYKKARAEGASTVKKEKEAPKVEEVPADDDDENFKPHGAHAQKRWNQLIKQRSEARAEAAAAKKLLEEERQARAQRQEEQEAPEEEQDQEETPAPSVANDDPEPERNTQAHDEWFERKIMRKNAATWAQLKAELAEKQETLRQYPDWDKTVGEKAITLLPATKTIFINMPADMKRALIYHWAKNANDRNSLSAIKNQEEQTAALLKFTTSMFSTNSTGKSEEVEETEEREQEAPEEKPEKPVSKAPPPIKPLTGGSTRSKLPLTHPNVSMQEYKRRRAAGEH